MSLDSRKKRGTAVIHLWRVPPNYRTNSFADALTRDLFSSSCEEKLLSSSELFGELVFLGETQFEERKRVRILRAHKWNEIGRKIFSRRETFRRRNLSDEILFCYALGIIHEQSVQWKCQFKLWASSISRARVKGIRPHYSRSFRAFNRSNCSQQVLAPNTRRCELHFHWEEKIFTIHEKRFLIIVWSELRVEREGKCLKRLNSSFNPSSARIVSRWSVGF